MATHIHKLMLRAFVVLCLLVSSVSAQDKALAKDLAAKDDRGFIIGLLEDALGGEGRNVRVNGFAGALSRTATIREITIGDDNGIWLTLDDLKLEWNRGALLRGRIEIERLSASKIKLDRLPIAVDDGLPAAESSGFALPKLPVSVSIAALSVDSIFLGAPLLGQPVKLALDASAQLADGSGKVLLNARRTDGQTGTFDIEASFSEATRIAVINLDLKEADDGIVARLVNLPGRPDLRLTVKGEGNINDLVTAISLETNGAPRLGGQVTLRGSTVAGRNFALDIAGDLTPLVPAEYHQFFGNRTALRAQGSQSPTGAIDLPTLDLRTGAVALQGAIALNPSYWPTKLALTGNIASPTTGAVVLPVAGGTTSIQGANLAIAYDAAISEDLEATFDITGLITDGVAIRTTQLTARGALKNALADQNQFQAAINFGARGAQFEDAALQDAVGENITGSLRVDYQTAAGLRLNDIAIAGTQYELAGALTIDGLEEEFETQIDVKLKAGQLARFSALAGRDIGGAAELAIAGTADLGGAFDLQVAGITTDLRVGIAQADRAMVGLTTLDLAVVRDTEGLRLSRLTMKNPQLQASGKAALKTDASQAEFDVMVANSAQIDRNLKGPMAVKGRATQDAGGWNVDTVVDGPFDATASIKGRATGTAPSLRYRLNLPNVGALGAGIEGPLSLDGTATQQGASWQIDTDISGLSGTRAQLGGVVFEDGTLDLNTTGTAPIALANPFLTPRNLQGQATFDLTMRGRPDLSSLSGTISTANAKLSAPTLRLTLENIAARIAIARGRVDIDLTGTVSTGGRIAARGPVFMAGVINADLSVALSDVRLVDPALYETSLGGQISLRGPLTGGALIAGEINVGETEIKVPTAQGSGFSIIPQIVHREAPAAVRQTLERANLNTTHDPDNAANAQPFGLNIRINAPARVFVRGRGLDAELGGALTLRGTTTQVVSAGRFDLIRGKLDLLGKRFELDEGSIALQGNLDPVMQFVATTTTESGTANIIIEGPASAPEVTFTSSPELPQDEVLAQIFFGRDASTMSAFQALQLANAVTTLAGKGGDGVVAKLRRGFGLDDLEVSTNDEGVTGLRLGKYISDNVYTDVTIDSENTAGVSINIDLSPSVTARGTLKSDGDSSVGVYFEKDY